MAARSVSVLYYGSAMLATVLLAAEFGFSKKYQLAEGTASDAVLRFNALSGLVSAIAMWCVAGFRLEWSFYSFALALGSSLCCMGYTLLGFRVLKLGGMALYTTFLMSGGMVLPYIFGILFLGEQLTAARILGILAVLAAVILTNFRKEKADRTLLLLCSGVFLLNGLVSILSKCHQIGTAFRPVESSLFVMYSGLCRFLLAALLLSTKSGPVWAIQKRGSVFVAAGAALIGGASYLLQLTCAKALPASVLYPIITGGSVVFSAAAGGLFFRERLSKRQLLGIALCMIGTLLFL